MEMAWCARTAAGPAVPLLRPKGPPGGTLQEAQGGLLCGGCVRAGAWTLHAEPTVQAHSGGRGGDWLAQYGDEELGFSQSAKRK
eukprot:scaffold137709_cov16-Tisochrysis_lutea.AAC.3